MTNFKTFFGDLTDFIANTIGGLFITLAVSAFLFAVVNFIWKRARGADGNGFKDARNQLGWSIIALFVLFSIWGIIAFLQSGIFGSSGTRTQIDAPSVRVNGGASGAAAGSATAPGSTAGVNRTPTSNTNNPNYDSRMTNPTNPAITIPAGCPASTPPGSMCCSDTGCPGSQRCLSEGLPGTRLVCKN